MGRINIFLNVHITPNNLKIQSNPYQNSNDIFHRNRKKNPKIHVEPQKTVSSPRDLDPPQKKKKKFGHITPLILVDFKMY